VLLHGWGGNHELMLGVAKRLRGCKCLLPDLIGFGHTPHPDYPLSVDDYVDAVVDMMAKADIKKACLVCHSFGARIGLKLAATRADFVSGLVITGGAGIKPKRKLSYYAKVFAHKVKKVLHLPTDLDGSPDYRNLSNAMKGTFVRVVNEDLTPLLPRISIDTLIVQGELDTETPTYMAEIMNKSIPSSSVVIMKGVGHFGYLERLNDFVEITQSYINAIE